MRRAIVALLVMSFAWLGMVRCVGTFTLTGKLNKFVVGLRDKGGWGWKFVGWIVFLVFAILPVYGIAILIDAVVLNSIEFWLDKQVLAYNDQGQATRTLQQGDERLVMQYTEFGKQMRMSLYKNEKLVKQFVLKKNQPGVFFVVKGDRLVPLRGDLERVNGQERVRLFEDGKQVLNRALSPAESRLVQEKRQMAIERLTKSAVEYAGMPVPGAL